MGKEQKRERGRESGSAVRERQRERERIRKTSTFPNISGALHEHVHLFPPSCLNKGISAYQVALSTPIAFCQTVLTSQSNALLFYAFHSASATRGLLRDRLVIS